MPFLSWSRRRVESDPLTREAGARRLTFHEIVPNEQEGCGVERRWREVGLEDGELGEREGVSEGAA